MNGYANFAIIVTLLYFAYNAAMIGADLRAEKRKSKQIPEGDVVDVADMVDENQATEVSEDGPDTDSVPPEADMAQEDGLRIYTPKPAPEAAPQEPGTSAKEEELADKMQQIEDSQEPLDPKFQVQMGVDQLVDFLKEKHNHSHQNQTQNVIDHL
jgi:hypothetical protein